MSRATVRLLMILAFASTAEAQENGIHVEGSGTVRAEPDIATFVFGIAGQTDSAANAMQRADAISGDLVRRLERLGIEPGDIRSTPVTLNPFVDRQTQRELIRFDRTTTVVLRDLDEFEKVNEAALEAGVNSIGDVRFSVADIEALQNRARDLALDDAREQAEAIAARLGVGLGRVLSVGVSRQFTTPVVRAAVQEFQRAADAGPEFRTGTIEVTQTASVSFEILQP